MKRSTTIQDLCNCHGPPKGRPPLRVTGALQGLPIQVEDQRKQPHQTHIHCFGRKPRVPIHSRDVDKLYQYVITRSFADGCFQAHCQVGIMTDSPFLTLISLRGLLLVSYRIERILHGQMVLGCFPLDNGPLRPMSDCSLLGNERS